MESNSTSLETMMIIFKQMEKSICKISRSNEEYGTGFFCTIPLDDWNSLKMLITNNYVLNESDISPGKAIKISLNNNKINLEILFDESRIVYSNSNYNVTFIEIKQKDGITKESFLDIDDKIFKDSSFDIFTDKPVYLLHYPKGVEVQKSDGKIKSINKNNYTIEHYCNIDSGSLGGPIILSNSNKVIGMNIGRTKEENNWNLGILMKLPIEKFVVEMKDKLMNKI